MQVTGAQPTAGGVSRRPHGRPVGTSAPGHWPTWGNMQNFHGPAGLRRWPRACGEKPTQGG